MNIFTKERAPSESGRHAKAPDVFSWIVPSATFGLTAFGASAAVVLNCMVSASDPLEKLYMLKLFFILGAAFLFAMSVLWVAIGLKGLEMLEAENVSGSWKVWRNRITIFFGRLVFIGVMGSMLIIVSLAFDSWSSTGIRLQNQLNERIDRLN